MTIYMRCAALVLAVSLAGCAGGSPVQGAGASQGSGVTVFGEIDVGVGRVR